MVFVMGGRGFVGSAYVRLLQRKEIPHEVVEIDNYQDFRGRSCDVLINANGNSKKFLATKDPVAEFDASIRTVCDSLHGLKYGKYVLCSTCDVYNNFENPDLNREDVEIDPSRQSRYGFHKLIAERFVRYEAKDYLIIRFGGFVGPNLKKNPIFDILSGGPLWLDPGSRLQYIHTDAAASIVWGLVERGLARETFNVCGDGLVTLKDVADHLGRTVPVQQGSQKVTYNINISKVKKYCQVPSSRETVLEFVDGFGSR
jgi:nucleoside-diphosphate-sugar epimerase